MPAVAPSVPKELLGADKHPVVAKAKATLAKTFKPTRAGAIDSGVTIAWYLLALGRGDEAASLARSIASVVSFTGNHALWSPAAGAICLAARLARIGKGEAQAAAHIARLVEHPALAMMTEVALRDWVAKADRSLAEARAAKLATSARNRAVAAARRACYFRETAGHGFYYDAWIDTAHLDRTIDGALGVLRERLGGEK